MGPSPGALENAFFALRRPRPDEDAEVKTRARPTRSSIPTSPTRPRPQGRDARAIGARASTSCTPTSRTRSACSARSTSRGAPVRGRPRPAHGGDPGPEPHDALHPELPRAGCAPALCPGRLRRVNCRGEFLTAYSGQPYEEHGRFQAIFEYQSMMGELLEMDAVNVPTYDGFQAAATGLRMAARLTAGKRVLVSAHSRPTCDRRLARLPPVGHRRRPSCPTRHRTGLWTSTRCPTAGRLRRRALREPLVPRAHRATRRGDRRARPCGGRDLRRGRRPDLAGHLAPARVLWGRHRDRRHPVPRHPHAVRRRARRVHRQRR